MVRNVWDQAFLVPIPFIFNTDLEKTKPTFIHSASKIILQYSFFFNLFSRRLALFGSFFWTYIHFYDLPANGIKVIQDSTFGLGTDSSGRDRNQDPTSRAYL
jgi:hypothetical protein